MAWSKDNLNNNHMVAQLTASLMRHHQQRVTTSSNMEQTVPVIKILPQIWGRLIKPWKQITSDKVIIFRLLEEDTGLAFQLVKSMESQENSKKWEAWERIRVWRTWIIKVRLCRKYPCSSRVIWNRWFPIQTLGFPQVNPFSAEESQAPNTWTTSLAAKWARIHPSRLRSKRSQTVPQTTPASTPAS